MQVCDGNHETCEIVRVSLFEYLLVKRMICFVNSLIKSDSDCTSQFRYYFRLCSNFYRVFSKLMVDEFGVDFLTNPLCALLARIDFVQRNEPRMREVTIVLFMLYKYNFCRLLVLYFFFVYINVFMKKS